MPEKEGLVLRIDAKRVHVEVDGAELALPLRGKLFEGRSDEKRPLAVGDRVRVELGAEGTDGVVLERLPRTTRLSRKAAGDDDREQVLAANVSLVLVVASVREPGFQPELVDRMLAAAEREELTAALVLTKVDRDRKDEARAWCELYVGLGYETILTSVAKGKETTAELARVRALLAAHTTVLCGASGVGKSSLLNALVPGLDLRVGSIGRIAQGRHTTTHTRLIPLPGGGHVLDTPGVRAFGLWGVGTQELGFYFREIAARSPTCAFRSCTHRHEPECAVLAAVERGEIAASRYRSYLLLYGEGEARERQEARGDT